MPFTREQLAALAGVFEQAAALRTDIVRCAVTPLPDDDRYLLVALETPTATRCLETTPARVCDGRTVGEIINAWVGYKPTVPIKAPLWSLTPMQATKGHKRRKMKTVRGSIPADPPPQGLLKSGPHR